jgi:hypothetical protein
VRPITGGMGISQQLIVTSQITPAALADYDLDQ